MVRMPSSYAFSLYFLKEKKKRQMGPVIPYQFNDSIRTQKKNNIQCVQSQSHVFSCMREKEESRA